jgi:hypothetical protein
VAISTNATTAGSTAKLQQYEQTFATSGVWQKPAGVTEVEVTCVGGGSGGYQGQPGSAGGYIKRLVNVTGISSAAIIVGAGSSGTAASSYPGNGGTSSFGSLVYAYGGLGATARWYNYGQNIGSLDAGLTEYMQTTSDGVAQLRHQEIYSYNLAGTATTPVPGSGTISYNNKTIWTGSQFVSVYVGSTNILTSPDGISWTTTNSTPVNISTIAYNGTYYVSVQSGVVSTTALYSSTLANGSWTFATLPTNQNWTGVTYGNGVFVAYSSGSTAGAYSTNGTTWTALTFPTAAGVTMAYLNGYFLGNGVYSTTGTSFTASSTGVNPTYFSYGNGIWTASAAYVNNTIGAAYYYTTNPASGWTAGVNPQLFSQGYSTMTYYGHPIFIYDRFVITGAFSASNYTNQTYMYTSTDAVNWIFVRTKMNPYYSLGGGMYYMQDSFLVNSRYYVFVLGNNNEGTTANYNTENVWIFSPYYLGGNAGQSQGYNYNLTSVSTSRFPGSPGTGSSSGNDGGIIYYTNYTATVTGYGYSLAGTGSIEGYAQGANFDGYYDHYSDSQGNTYKPSFGSGGRGYGNTGTTSGALPWQPGGNGIVILKWWQ